MIWSSPLARISEGSFVEGELGAHLGANVEDERVRDIALRIGGELDNGVAGDTALHLRRRGSARRKAGGDSHATLTRQKAVSERYSGGRSLTMR